MPLGVSAALIKNGLDKEETEGIRRVPSGHLENFLGDLLVKNI